MAGFRAASDGLQDAPEYRVEGQLKVTGTARYAADARRPGTLFLAYVRSPWPHARIRSIDVSAARRLGGVHAVVTGNDLPQHARFGRRIQDWPVLARDVVRFVGDRVAAVAAETRQLAHHAASLVEVDYEQLPAILSMEAALLADEPIVHPHAEDYVYFGTRAKRRHANIQGELVVTHGTDAGRAHAFRQAYRVFEHTFRTPREHQGYIEPHACLVWLDGERVHVVSTNKTPFALRAQLASTLGLPEEQIVVDSRFIGGDFGGKGTSLDEYTCYFLARATGRPVAAQMSYADELGAANPRHAASVTVRTAVDAEGHFLAHESHVLLDGGAYGAGKPLDGLVVRGGLATLGAYRVPETRLELVCVYTNNVPGGHMRAPGAVQGLFAGESHVDMIAAELGIDRLELRLRNALRDGETSSTGERIRESRLHEALTRMRSELRWDEPRPTNVGRGVAAEIRHVGGGKTSLVLRLVPESGEIEVLTGMVDQGAGAHTVIQRVAAVALSVAPRRIVVRYADTASAPLDPGAGGSRVTHVLGQAALDGGQRLKTTLQDLAAEVLGWRAGSVELTADQFVSDGLAVSFDDAARRIGAAEATGSYGDAPHGHDEPGDFNTSVYGVEVSVDRDTGAVSVLNAVQVVDQGTIINPLAHDGQIQGGFVMGLGAALSEELLVEDGQVTTLTLGDYKLPSVSDIPPLRTVVLSTDIGPGPFGAKAVGEVTNSGVAPAVANAVADAIGARVLELPITAERVLRAQLGD
jgi:CO/xanthine dehydrogenase Mo-binding subunit